MTTVALTGRIATCARGRRRIGAGRALAIFLLAALAGGCAPFQPGLPSEPVANEERAATGPGAVIAREAQAQIGVPYRWGGSDPGAGFDCSGLVAYVHAREGIVVPRTAAEQFEAADRIDEDELRPGDLVFFRLESRRRGVSHVGIYTGQRRFVHAPQSGRDVAEANLEDPYYRDRFAGAGRFYDSGAGRGPRLKSPP
ncbi:MAG TPA: C40 family peptidase [Steroidobacteraceae bacterium]|nr:C40 family peptidase [Steroidobacteraceae bacterium]